jgi:uncharacterized membrane protein YesL
MEKNHAMKIYRHRYQVFKKQKKKKRKTEYLILVIGPGLKISFHCYSNSKQELLYMSAIFFPKEVHIEVIYIYIIGTYVKFNWEKVP